MTYFADKAPIKLAENRSALSTPVTSSVVARNRPLVTVDLRGVAYAASRISSTLKGSTKQFGWLQAPATKISFPFSRIMIPATIRISNFRIWLPSGMVPPMTNREEGFRLTREAKNPHKVAGDGFRATLGFYRECPGPPVCGKNCSSKYRAADQPRRNHYWSIGKPNANLGHLRICCTPGEIEQQSSTALQPSL